MKRQEMISDVDTFIEKSLQHKGEYVIEIEGKSLWVHPQVMSPKYSYSPRFFIQNWDIKKGMTVLDIGTGTGILALFAALKGAKYVVATDTNPHACTIAEKNMQENNVADKIKIINSNLFTNIRKEKFDRILFNAPYWNKKADPSIPLTYGVFDENYKTIKRFFKESKDYLNHKGKILLGFSTQDNAELIKKMIYKAGLVIEKEIRETKGHTRILFYLIPENRLPYLHKIIKLAPKIGVFGSDGDHCTPKSKKIAYEVGKLLAERGAIVYTGGFRGVMEASSMGASETGGLTVGILAGDDLTKANQFCSLVIPTGVGFARAQIIANSVDAAIIVEGGLGTLQEAAYLYWLQKPTISISTSGGIAKQIAGKSLDKRKLKPIVKSKSAEEAVNIVFKLLKG